MLVPLVANLRANNDLVFPKHMMLPTTINQMKVHAWWRSLATLSTIGESAINFCESIMLLPASTAAIERSFSTLGDILTKKRNQLKVDRAKKLCVVYKTLASVESDNETESEDDNESEGIK